MIIVKIDYKRDELLDPYARRLLQEFYLLPNESSPQDAFARAAVAFCGGDSGLAQRINDGTSRRWGRYSSPILSNAPVGYGRVSKTMPISCFLQYVPNSLKGLIEHSAESRWLSVMGGGIGACWSYVQSVGSTLSSGAKHPGAAGFLHTHDADVIAYRQGDTRRASYSAHQSVRHPEHMSFIGMRRATGDVNRKNHNLHHASIINDAFLDAIRHNKPWPFIDPRTGEHMGELPAREVWNTIIETRFETGEPHIVQIDEANRHLNPWQKALGLEIHSSNLCTEIFEVTNEDLTAVCCLFSVNLETYDEWKDTTWVADITRYLDNVLQYFIDNAPAVLSKAVASATNERSIGIGAMGFSTLLQKLGIPWESAMAVSLNRNIFKNIKDQALAESQKLAVERGEPPHLIGSGRRNANLLAIAPNANNSVILGVSPSIEPEIGVAYVRDTRVGTGIYKNKYFENLLIEKYPELNTSGFWKRIISNGGSLEGLDELPDEVKQVFKGAYDIDQHAVVSMARSRQEYVCQGQSVNLFFRSGASRAYLQSVHYSAFDPTLPFQPLKSLYYLRSEAGRETDNVTVQRQRAGIKSGECVSCEG